MKSSLDILLNHELYQELLKNLPEKEREEVLRYVDTILKPTFLKLESSLKLTEGSNDSK